MQEYRSDGLFSGECMIGTYRLVKGRTPPAMKIMYHVLTLNVRLTAELTSLHDATQCNPTGLPCIHAYGRALQMSWLPRACC